jgi:hypothetical protein
MDDKTTRFIEFNPDDMATGTFNGFKYQFACDAARLGDIMYSVTMKDVTSFMGVARVVLATIGGKTAQERFDFFDHWFDYASAGMQQRQQMSDDRDPETGEIFEIGEEVEYAPIAMVNGPTKTFKVECYTNAPQAISRSVKIRFAGQGVGGALDTAEVPEWVLWVWNRSIEYREKRAKMITELREMRQR